MLKIANSMLTLPILDKDQNNRIEYLYDALGNKKRQIEYRLEGLKIKMTTTDFIGNFVYIDGKPAWNTFDEGRVVYTSAGTCFAENYIKDHLGNVRVAYGNDGSGSLIRQVNAYYPFGMTISFLSGEPSNIRASENEYLYNGKMFQNELGLNWYDYGARFYDAVVGRWWSVDPVCEIGGQESVTPYVYVYDNPVTHNDPDGRFPFWAVVGAALDYGLQVYDNYKTGSSVGDVNFVSVGLSTVNPSGKFKVLKTIAVEGVKAATENSTTNKGLQVNTNIKEVGMKTAINSGVDVSTGKLIKASSSDAVNAAEKETAAANKQLKTLERQAQRSPNSTRKAENVNKAKSNVQNTRSKEVRTQMLNSTIGKAPEATQQAAKSTTDRILKDEKK